MQKIKNTIVTTLRDKFEEVNNEWKATVYKRLINNIQKAA